MRQLSRHSKEQTISVGAGEIELGGFDTAQEDIGTYMLFIAAFLASTLALSPQSGGESEGAVPAAPFILQSFDQHSRAGASEAPVESRTPSTPGWLAIEAWREEREAHQVRIR